MEEYTLPDRVFSCLTCQAYTASPARNSCSNRIESLSLSRFPFLVCIDFYLFSNMSADDLVEIDSLEATVIIDNELDPLSTIAPDTVHVTGLMGNVARCARDTLDDRGPGCKELRMEDICCSAHGLSILVVCIP